MSFFPLVCCVSLAVSLYVLVLVLSSKAGYCSQSKGVRARKFIERERRGGKDVFLFLNSAGIWVH